MDNFSANSVKEYISLKEVMTERFKKAGWKYVENPNFKANDYTKYLVADILINSAFLKRGHKKNDKGVGNTINCRVIETLVSFQTRKELKSFISKNSGEWDLNINKESTRLAKEYLERGIQIKQSNDWYKELYPNYVEFFSIMYLIKTVLADYQHLYGGDTNPIYQFTLDCKDETNDTTFDIGTTSEVVFISMINSFPELVTFYKWYINSLGNPRHFDSFLYSVVRINDVNEEIVNKDFIDISNVVDIADSNILLFKMGYRGSLPDTIDDLEMLHHAVIDWERIKYPTIYSNKYQGNSSQ